MDDGSGYAKALDDMIAASSGELRALFVAHKDTLDASEFWFKEASCLVDALGEALKFMPAGPARTALSVAMKASRVRVQAHFDMGGHQDG